MAEPEQPGRYGEERRNQIIARQMQLHRQDLNDAEFVIGREALQQVNNAEYPRNPDGWAA